MVKLLSISKKTMESYLKEVDEVVESDRPQILDPWVPDLLILRLKMN